MIDTDNEEPIQGGAYRAEKIGGLYIDLRTLQPGQMVAYGDGQTYFFLLTPIETDKESIKEIIEKMPNGLKAKIVVHRMIEVYEEVKLKYGSQFIQAIEVDKGRIKLAMLDNNTDDPIKAFHALTHTLTSHDQNKAKLLIAAVVDMMGVKFLADNHKSAKN